MANESSFLEKDSFLDLPPLKLVNSILDFNHLITITLGDSYLDMITDHELGSLTLLLFCLTNVLQPSLMTNTC